VIDDFGEFSDFSKLVSKDCRSFLVFFFQSRRTRFEENFISPREFDDDLTQFKLLRLKLRYCRNNYLFKILGSAERVFDGDSLTELRDYKLPLLGFRT